MAQQTAEAETQNPTLSWSNGGANDTDKNNEDSQTNMYHQQQQDDLAIAQNGGVSSPDEDDMDGESGSDMDDDLMDKISSSPSIEDGALYPALTTVAWPRRDSSLTLLPRQPSTVNMFFNSASQKGLNYCGNKRPLPFRETSVSRQERGLNVAEWRRWPRSGPNIQLRPQSSELDGCERFHGGLGSKQEKHNDPSVDDGYGHLSNLHPILSPQFPFDQD